MNAYSQSTWREISDENARTMYMLIINLITSLLIIIATRTELRSCPFEECYFRINSRHTQRGRMMILRNQSSLSHACP